MFNSIFCLLTADIIKLDCVISYQHHVSSEYWAFDPPYRSDCGALPLPVCMHSGTSPVSVVHEQWGMSETSSLIG